MTLITYKDPVKTRERLKSLTGQSERLKSLEIFHYDLDNLVKMSESLLFHIGDFVSGDLSPLSDILEDKYQESDKDPEIWSETKDLINLIYPLMTGLSDSLIIFTVDMKEDQDKIMTLINQTADLFCLELLETMAPSPRLEEIRQSWRDSGLKDRRK